MKKNILFVLALILMFSVSLFAQEGFHLGASGTFNSTWVLNQNNYGTLAPFAKGVVRVSEMNYKPTWGGNAGIVLGYNGTKNWGIQGEIQYNVTGQKYEDNFIGPAIIPEDTFGSDIVRVNVTRDIKLSYFQIPIMAKFTSTKVHVAKAYVMIGPQFGVRISASEEVKVAGYVYLPDSLAFTPKQKFQSFDVGLVLQTGADIYATDKLYFSAGITMYGGLFDINGKVLRNLDWYSKNDVNYQKSFNFRGGITLGVHYIFGEGRIDY